MRDPDDFTRRRRSHARRERLPPIAVVILVGFAAFWVLLLAAVCAVGGGTVAPWQPSNAEAFTMCKQFMQQRLRAPATAGFASYMESTVRHDAGDYVVLSHVDAQNGFGALIRTRYTCTVRSTGVERWSLVSLVTDP